MDTLCSLTASSQSYNQNSPKTSRVLALSNTAVKHNEGPSCHFHSFDVNAPNSCLFPPFRSDIVYAETSFKGAWFNFDEPWVWRIRALQTSQVTNRRWEGGTFEFCFHSRGKKFPETWVMTRDQWSRVGLSGDPRNTWNKPNNPEFAQFYEIRQEQVQLFKLLKPLSQGMSCLWPYYCVSISCLFLMYVILHYFPSVQHFEKLLLLNNRQK